MVIEEFYWACDDDLCERTFPAAGLEIGSLAKGNSTGILLPCMILHETGDHPATALFPVTVTFKELKLLTNRLNRSGMSLSMALCTGS